MTRNKALRAIQARVAQRERDVIEAVLSWMYSRHADPSRIGAVESAAEALLDARALLSEATETAQ